MREIYKTAQRSSAPGCRRHRLCRGVSRSDEKSISSTGTIWWSMAPYRRPHWTAQQQGYVAMRKAFDQGAG